MRHFFCYKRISELDCIHLFRQKNNFPKIVLSPRKYRHSITNIDQFCAEHGFTGGGTPEWGKEYISSHSTIHLWSIRKICVCQHPAKATLLYVEWLSWSFLRKFSFGLSIPAFPNKYRSILCWNRSLMAARLSDNICKLHPSIAWFYSCLHASIIANTSVGKCYQKKSRTIDRVILSEVD